MVGNSWLVVAVLNSFLVVLSPLFPLLLLVVSSFKLFPYQSEALRSVWVCVRRARERQASGESGPIRAVCVQPTGAGKTVEIFCLIREVVKRFGWRCLVIEPTRELVRQTVGRAQTFIPECKAGVLKRGKEFRGMDLVVSTAGGLNKKALARIDPADFQLVIFDEAHHTASESWHLIFNHLSGCLLMLGFTATHIRGDQRSIASEEYFQSVVVYQTIGQLTQAGYLSPARGYFFHTGLVLENVPIRGGQYDERKLAHAVNIPERNQMAVDAWLRFAKGRSTISFCADISHAQNVAQCFLDRGVPAAAVWGQMDPDEYERIMERYQRREILQLVNAKLLVEGFDAKFTSAIEVLRPATEVSARVLGPQMFGRGLRIDQGKVDCVIIELMDKEIRAGTSKGSSLNSLIGSSYGVPKERIEGEGGYLHEQERAERVQEAWRERLKMHKWFRSVESVEETFDVIERVSKVSELAWLPLGASTYMMPIGDGGFIECCREHENYFEVRAVVDNELEFIGSGGTFKEAMAIADGWVARHGLNFNLQVRSRPWRKLEPRPGQIFKAHMLTGLPREFLSGLTRGQLSDLITSAEALLLRDEEITVSTKTSSQEGPIVGGGNSLHLWQFGSGRNAA